MPLDLRPEAVVFNRYPSTLQIPHIASNELTTGTVRRCDDNQFYSYNVAYSGQSKRAMRGPVCVSVPEFRAFGHELISDLGKVIMTPTSNE